MPWGLGSRKGRGVPTEGFVNPNASGLQGGVGVANPNMPRAGGDPGYQEAAAFDGGYQDAQPVSFDVRTYDSSVPTISQPKGDAGGYMAVDPQWLEEQNSLMARKPWFRKSFTRAQAQDYLMREDLGGFVVRMSSMPGHYAISCQMGYKVENMLILPSWDPTKSARGETLYRLGSASEIKFASVPELIYYYAQNPFFTDGRGTQHFFAVSPQELTAVASYVQRAGGMTSTDTGYMEVTGLEDSADTDVDFGQNLYDNNPAGGATASPAISFNTNAYDNAGSGFPAGDSVQFETNVYDNAPASASVAEPAPEVSFSTNVYDNAAGGSVAGAGGLVLTPEEAPVYEKLYNQADPTGAGELGPGAAVAFFRKTGLDDVTLGNVWALADTHQAGFLDRSQVLLALKLCAVIQNGYDLDMANVNLPCSPPVME